MTKLINADRQKGFGEDRSLELGDGRRIWVMEGALESNTIVGQVVVRQEATV
jgi:hypothetical protein